jgi:hypothetical protein
MAELVTMQATSGDEGCGTVRPATERALWAGAAIALWLISGAGAHAQSPTVNDLKAKIFDARMAQQTFLNGLRFCAELDGTNFYFAPRNRVLKLEDYHRSLENLASAQTFNPETRRPWSVPEANARWEQVKQQAVRDKDNCALVASLPDLEKQLKELETKHDESQKKD